MGEHQGWQADVLIEAKYWRFFAEKIHKKFEPLFLYSLGVFISEWKQICLFCKKRRNRQSCLTRFTLWTFFAISWKKWMTKLIPRANQDHTSFQTRFIIFLAHWATDAILILITTAVGCGAWRTSTWDHRDLSIHIERACQLHDVKMTRHGLLHKGLTSAD